MQRDAQVAHDTGVSLRELIKTDPATGLKILPHWLAQPYFRPLPPPHPNSKNHPKKGSEMGMLFTLAVQTWGCWTNFFVVEKRGISEAFEEGGEGVKKVRLGV